jgi:hypothetical protein
LSDVLVGCNLEDFNFLDWQIQRTRENDSRGQSGVVGVNSAKASVTVGVCVAVIGNTNATKAWTSIGRTIDCFVLLFGLQCKSPRWDVVRILQREKKTLLTLIRLAAVLSVNAKVEHSRFPFHRSEAAENVSFCVQKHSQSVCVTVISAVKFLCFSTIATVMPYNPKLRLSEFHEDLRKVRNDQQIE